MLGTPSTATLVDRGERPRPGPAAQRDQGRPAGHRQLPSSSSSCAARPGPRWRTSTSSRWRATRTAPRASAELVGEPVEPPSIGCSGLLVIKSPHGRPHHPGRGPRWSASRPSSTGGAGLENGANSFLVVIASPDAASSEANRPTTATTMATLELPAGAVLVDADRLAQTAIFPWTASSTGASTSPTPPFTSDAAAQITDHTCRLAANAWYGGDLLGNDPAALTGFDPAERFPAGAASQPTRHSRPVPPIRAPLPSRCRLRRTASGRPPPASPSCSTSRSTARS